jgi:uncharacterized protein YjbJ (UPF0337 family)
VNNSDLLDIAVLEDYLDGKLDPKTMHRVERLSLEDPFVAEALAGLSLSPKRVQSLSLLQKQLQERVAQKPVVQKRWQITSQRLSIAAAAAVLCVTVSLLFWMREKGNREQMAANGPKNIEVAIAAKQAPQKPAGEVEQVIEDAKDNAYARNPVVAEPTTTRSTAKKLTNPQAVSSAATALQGRVAGLNIANDQQVIKGVVYDDNKLPVNGAYVKVEGKPITTITNEKGEFSLVLDSLPKDQKLSVSNVGYQRSEVQVKKGQDLMIQMKADNSTLAEVVVVRPVADVAKRTASAAAAKLIKPDPVGGWDKFQTYLIDSNRLLVDKKPLGKHITVKFDLAKDGTPINISASSTSASMQLSAEEVQEAIRLFKDGPKWVLPGSLTSSGSTSVNIRF